MTPWDVAKDLSYKKKRLIDSDNENYYARESFTINRFFSLFRDTIFYSNNMNCNSHIDGLLQHDYYFYGLRKSNRYEKWVKKDKSKELNCIRQYYGYNETRAKEAMKLLSKKQIQHIVKLMNPE